MSTAVTIFQNTVGSSSDTDDVQETLSSIQRLMALSGLSWDYKHSKSTQRFTPASVAARIYSSLVCIVFMLVFVRVIPTYTKADSLTGTSIAISGHVIVVLSLIYWGLSTNIHSKIRIFCQRLHETHLTYNNFVPNPSLRKRVKRACLCSQVFAFVMSVVCGISIGMTTEQSSELYWPLIVLYMLYGGCTTLQNISILLLCLSISLILTYEYDVCTMRLVQASKGSVKEEEIDDIRGYHASITGLVEYVCSFISIHVAAAYLTSFLIICFSLYIVINDGPDIQFIMFSAYSFFFATMYLITLTYLGIRLHEAAHRPLNILHDVAGRRMSDRVMALVTLFANKLSQRQIGITASGLVTITKDTVLTIIGTLLTYVFIVIQFKPDLNAGLPQTANNTAG